MIAPFSKFGTEACPLQQKGEGGGGGGGWNHAVSMHTFLTISQVVLRQLFLRKVLEALCFKFDFSVYIKLEG